MDRAGSEVITARFCAEIDGKQRFLQWVWCWPQEMFSTHTTYDEGTFVKLFALQRRHWQTKLNEVNSEAEIVGCLKQVDFGVVGNITSPERGQ